LKLPLGSNPTQQCGLTDSVDVTLSTTLHSCSACCGVWWKGELSGRTQTHTHTHRSVSLGCTCQTCLQMWTIPWTWIQRERERGTEKQRAREGHGRASEREILEQLFPSRAQFEVPVPTRDVVVCLCLVGQHVLPLLLLLFNINCCLLVSRKEPQLGHITARGLSVCVRVCVCVLQG